MLTQNVFQAVSITLLWQLLADETMALLLAICFHYSVNHRFLWQYEVGERCVNFDNKPFKVREKHTLDLPVWVPSTTKLGPTISRVYFTEHENLTVKHVSKL